MGVSHAIAESKNQENIHLLVTMYEIWRDKQKLLKEWV